MNISPVRKGCCATLALRQWCKNDKNIKLCDMKKWRTISTVQILHNCLLLDGWIMVDRQGNRQTDRICLNCKLKKDKNNSQIKIAC